MYSKDSKSRRIAVISADRLGDGLIMAAFARILSMVECEVDFFHPYFSEISRFYPNVNFKPYPEDILETLLSYDQVFAEFSRSSFSLSLDSIANQNSILRTRLNYFVFSEQTKHVLKLSKNDFILNARESFLSQMNNIAFSIIGKTFSPEELFPQAISTADKHPSQVVIHPFSARQSKNWSLEKFQTLGNLLIKHGFEPLFCVSPQEETYLKNFTGKHHVCSNYDDWFQIMQKSKYFIGNDSGPAHLASFFQLRSLVLFSRRSYLPLWQPAFHDKIKVIAPLPFLPNFSGFRLRERWWGHFLSEKKVLKEFLTIAKAPRALDK
jgi:ADP-heptose:LPS heptosyltransferase